MDVSQYISAMVAKSKLNRIDRKWKSHPVDILTTSSTMEQKIPFCSLAGNMMQLVCALTCCSPEQQVGAVTHTQASKNGCKWNTVQNIFLNRLCRCYMMKKCTQHICRTSRINTRETLNCKHSFVCLNKTPQGTFKIMTSDLWPFIFVVYSICSATYRQ